MTSGGEELVVAALTRAIARMRSRLRTRAIRIDVAAGLVLGVLSLAPPLDVKASSLGAAAFAVLAVAVRSVSPSIALSLAWLLAIVQFTLGERPGVANVALLLVVYSASRLGNRWEAGAAGLSAVFGGALATAYLGETGARYVQLTFGTPEQKAFAAVAPIGLLLIAWLAGLAVKFFHSQRSESLLRIEAQGETVKALDMASAERLRATMARDVHDIVGHSLAVIIAQADSVEFLDDEARIRRVAATIAATARTSLQEVRGVLNGMTSGGATDEPQDLESIVEQIRAAGVMVDRVVRGTQRHTEATHAVVIRRVAQEMMTNALRHGEPGQPIVFRESWRSGDVVLEVENLSGSVGNPGSGSGIDGMRSRIDGVGGSFEAEAVEGVFTARARIPLPAIEVVVDQPKESP